MARFDTQIIHAGEPHPRIAGAVVTPIFQSSTFEHSGDTGYHDVRYIRLNNTPNHVALHAKLAAIEGGEDALVTASGMAAISTAILALAKTGDHLLVQSNLYGGTHSFVTQDLAALGITHDFIDADRPETWEALIRPNTRLIYVEAATNPLLQVGDHVAVAKLARARGLVSMIDNTFASPVLFRPLEHGFDLSLHSATKYLNGHTDIVAGAVIGSRALIAKVKHKLDHFGGALDPHACFLLMRGMKTLSLRVLRQSENALALARFLESHAAVSRVAYPGLESHPAHVRARSLFTGGFGGMFSFELRGGVDAAVRFISTARIPVSAPSLGGVETLMTRPVTTSHAGLSPSERAAAGISDALIRVSVGIEDVRDLIEDFAQALA